ncbi:MAG: hypothetical protein J6P55_08650 [Bacteroidaceae bacterium]|nr:hypothetical protein [Bacteroidaceae bacterium]
MERKRYIASWVLLAVFLPTLLLSSLHIHHESEANEISCNECVQHHCHGHLSQLSDSMHHCVLCQFLTLTFVAGSACAVVFFSHVSRLLHIRPLCGHCSDRCGIIVTRGPPACI